MLCMAHRLFILPPPMMRMLLLPPSISLFDVLAVSVAVCCQFWCFLRYDFRTYFHVSPPICRKSKMKENKIEINVRRTHVRRSTHYRSVFATHEHNQITNTSSSNIDRLIVKRMVLSLWARLRSRCFVGAIVAGLFSLQTIFSWINKQLGSMVFLSFLFRLSMHASILFMHRVFPMNAFKHPEIGWRSWTYTCDLIGFVRCNRQIMYT